MSAYKRNIEYEYEKSGCHSGQRNHDKQAKSIDIRKTEQHTSYHDIINQTVTADQCSYDEFNQGKRERCKNRHVPHRQFFAACYDKNENGCCCA